jgi:hypothetical protein
MKIIKLTDEQYDKLIDELHELQSFRWNSDHCHADDCGSDSLINIELNVEDVE